MKSKARKLTQEELLKMAKGRPTARRTAQLRNGQFVTVFFARLGGKNIGRGEDVLFETADDAIQVAQSARDAIRNRLKIK